MRVGAANLQAMSQHDPGQLLLVQSAEEARQVCLLECRKECKTKPVVTKRFLLTDQATWDNTKSSLG